MVEGPLLFSAEGAVDEASAALMMVVDGRLDGFPRDQRKTQGTTTVALALRPATRAAQDLLP